MFPIVAFANSLHRADRQMPGIDPNGRRSVDNIAAARVSCIDETPGDPESHETDDGRAGQFMPSRFRVCGKPGTGECHHQRPVPQARE
ncbi:MAG: hypothetical protein OEM83_02640 [Gammaproteobacteria bacterium]|nr:hypothetical protein [Gammaproteobacteria bacterium]MDH5511887.1 hypothetical protein [Gammaproteobacteria bacterium]